MKINKIIIAFAMLILSLNGYSQSKEQTFHLKNGSVITGEVIEETRENYKVKTEDGNVFIFSKREIFDPSKAKVKILFHSRLELVGGSMYTTNNSGIFGMNGLLGFTVGNQFYLGLAVEYQETSQRKHIPIFIDMRLDLLKKKVSPYIFVNAGFATNIWKDRNYSYSYEASSWSSNPGESLEKEVSIENDTGRFGRAGIGCEYKLNEKINLLISAFVSHNAYHSKYDQAKSQEDNSIISIGLPKQADKYFNVVGLKLGIGIN